MKKIFCSLLPMFVFIFPGAAFSSRQGKSAKATERELSQDLTIMQGVVCATQDVPKSDPGVKSDIYVHAIIVFTDDKKDQDILIGIHRENDDQVLSDCMAWKSKTLIHWGAAEAVRKLR